MLNDTTPNEELVRRWQAGEDRERSFTVLHQRFAAELARTFRRMGFDDETSKELLQETLLQAFRGLEKFRQSSSFRTWIHHIARNSALKRLRSRDAKKRSGQTVPLDEAVDGHEKKLVLDPNTGGERSGPLGRLEAEEQERQVSAALRELPEADQRIVRFRIWQGLSVRETAQAMNKPEGTIKSGWARIRGTLKKKLGPQVSDLPP